LPDKLPSAVMTGTVQVRFADGSEHTLPIHGITQLDYLAILDELEIKSFDEFKVKASEPTLQMIRVIQRVAVEALTSQKDPWSIQRIQESFSDMIEVTKIFMACFNISNLPKGGKVTSSAPKKTPYG